MNGGKNGGRTCWAVAGTFCGGKVQGSYAAKLLTCIQCDFYDLVYEQERRSVSDAEAILAKLR
jgi:hypothetical protein